MTESVEDYALLFEELKEIGAADPEVYVKYLFSRVGVIIEESPDERARNFVAECNKLIELGKDLLNDDSVSHLRCLLSNYSNEEHLTPHNKEYYYSMSMVLGCSVVEYIQLSDEGIFMHICEQYETMLQVANYLIDGSGIYAGDLKEVCDRFFHKSEKNTYFKQFSRLINMNLN